MVKKNEIFIFQRMLLLTITIFIAISIFNYFLNDNKKVEHFNDNSRNERIRRFKSLSIDPDEEINNDNKFKKILNEPFQNRLQSIINEAGMELNATTFKSNISQLEEEAYKIIKADVVLSDYFEKIYFRYRYVPKENVILLFPNQKIDLDLIKKNIIKLIPSMIDKYASDVKHLTPDQKEYAKKYLSDNLDIYLKIKYLHNQSTSTTQAKTINEMMFPETTKYNPTQPQRQKISYFEEDEEFSFSKNSLNTIEKDYLIAYLNYNEISEEQNKSSNNNRNNINSNSNSKISSLALEPIEDTNRKLNPDYVFIEIRYKIKNFDPKIDRLLKKWNF
jgi:hypothetical protein